MRTSCAAVSQHPTRRHVHAPIPDLRLDWLLSIRFHGISAAHSSSSACRSEPLQAGPALCTCSSLMVRPACSRSLDAPSGGRVCNVAQCLECTVCNKLCQSERHACGAAAPSHHDIRDPTCYTYCIVMQMAAVGDRNFSSNFCGQPCGQLMEQVMLELTLVRLWLPNTRCCCAAAMAASLR